MLNILLMRTDEDDGIQLNLPAEPEDIRVAREWMYLHSGPAAQIRAAEVQSPLPKLTELLTGVSVGNDQALKEINFLGNALESFTDDELARFTAAIEASSVRTIPDIINAIGNLERYANFPGVTTNRELGKYIVEHGMKLFPESAVPYLDYERIGIEYESGHSMYYSPRGMVAHDERPDRYHYDGINLPKLKSGLVFRAELMSEYYHERPYILFIPINDMRLRKALDTLHVDNLDECSIRKLTSPQGIEALAQNLPGNYSVSSLNKLAAVVVAKMPRLRDVNKFLAAMEIEQPGDLHGCIEIAENLNRYTLLKPDIQSPEDYANYIIYSNDDPVYIDDTVADFVDYKALGEHWMKQNGVRRTKCGLLVRTDSPFPYIEMELPDRETNHQIQSM